MLMFSKKKGTNLETKLLEVRPMSRPKFVLPSLAKLKFKTNVNETCTASP